MREWAPCNQWPWAWEFPAWRQDTRVERPLWGLHPPAEQTPGADSSQDYLVVVPYASFGDTSSSLVREPNVDIEVTTSSLHTYTVLELLREVTLCHIHSPLAPTRLEQCSLGSLYVQTGLLKASEGGRQLCFHGWKKTRYGGAYVC